LKPRKSKDIAATLLKKGFILEPSKDHHQFYYLTIEGKKHNVYTYLSHGIKEYNKNLMGKIKQQLKFNETDKAEAFFDCPMSETDYKKMLVELGLLK